MGSSLKNHKWVKVSAEILVPSATHIYIHTPHFSREVRMDLREVSCWLKNDNFFLCREIKSSSVSSLCNGQSGLCT